MTPQWFYAKGRQKHGPASLAHLQRLAAAGHILPTDMVLPAGSQKWVLASSVNELFQPSSTNGAQTAMPGPVSSPAHNRIVANAWAFGQWVLHEPVRVAVATWAQTARLAGYGRASWRKRSLRQAVQVAEVALGQRMDAAGVGDQGLRAELAGLDGATHAGEPDRNASTRVQAKREQLLRQLASVAYVRQPPPGREHEWASLKNVRARADEVSVAMKIQKVALSPKGTAGWARIVVGYVSVATCALALLLVVVSCPSGERR